MDLLISLVAEMDDRQHLELKKALVRQTIYYVSKKLPPEAEDEGESRFICYAEDWLKTPNSENAKKASTAAIFDCVDGGVRYFDYSDYFLEPAWAAGAENAIEAASHALKAAEDLKEIAYSWQIDCARAILGNSTLPPFE